MANQDESNDRLLDKLHKQLGEPPAKRRKVEETPIDHVKRILDSNNCFETMEVDLPTLDLLNRPQFDFSLKALKKSFRKLSSYVHPDRNNGSEEATKAFRKLSEANQTLLNDVTREIAVKEYTDKLKLSRPHDYVPPELERASQEEKLKYYSMIQKQKQDLEKADMEAFQEKTRKSFQERIARQKARAEEQKRLDEIKRNYVNKAGSSDSEEDSDSDDDSDSSEGVVVNRGRKRKIRRGI